MDVPLQPGQTVYRILNGYGFNPCFNGCPSSTFMTLQQLETDKGFNPCFNGCPSSTKKNIPLKKDSSFVSILVLMDVPLQP